MSLPNGQKVVAFDFDGVLHEYHGWNGGVLQNPLPGAFELVKLLQERGAHVVVHTTRSAEVVQKWLREHGAPCLDVYNEKWQRIDVFVDDRALHFTPGLLSDVGGFASALLAFEPHWRTSRETPE